MNRCALVFPHQLYEQVPFPQGLTVLMVEEFLFFRQYKFHKEKLVYHRATMKTYQQHLEAQGYEVEYIDALRDVSDVRKLIPRVADRGCTEIHYIDPTDDWLHRRIQAAIKSTAIAGILYPTQLFVNSAEDNRDIFQQERKKYFQTKFYIAQRRRLGILLDDQGGPLGGKWSFDAENRKKYPGGKAAPPIYLPESTELYKEAVTYVLENFPRNPGATINSPRYPIDFAQSKVWLHQFLEFRFHEFGPYEDAIVKEESILHHSVLTPMLNVGLLRPLEVVHEAIRYADLHQVPLNSTEGFVRQIISWREFIRGIYERHGSRERTRNYWGFSRKIPPSFYDGTTGIVPVDATIKKVLETGYCHHIERLMILGNFMLLCEFDPDEVYRWFMELFIDAYDWVMVPNVYGMSQFADGGLLATKPYISGSNYILKMSNYRKGDWQASWDGLFWRFMHVHRTFFIKNARLGMLVRTFDKMDASRKSLHMQHAESYLASLGTSPIL